MADRPTLTPKAERAIALLGWGWDPDAMSGRGCFFQRNNGAVRCNELVGEVYGRSQGRWRAFEVGASSTTPSEAVLAYAAGARLGRDALGDLKPDDAAAQARALAAEIRAGWETCDVAHAAELLERLAAAVEWL